MDTSVGGETITEKLKASKCYQMYLKLLLQYFTTMMSLYLFLAFLETINVSKDLWWKHDDTSSNMLWKLLT